MNKINEELNHIKYLFGYKKGKILSEQEYPVTTEDTTDDPNYVTKSKNIKLQGPGYSGPLGTRLSPGSLNLSFNYTKQIDKELNTVGDVLQKMSEELQVPEFQALPANFKTKLAEGYFNAINMIIDGQNFKGIEGKQKRRLKKFFRKSQKWKFAIDDLTSENVSGKVKATKLDVLDIEFPATKDETLLQEFINMVDTSLFEMLENNTKPKIILGNEASLFRFLEDNEISEDGIAELLPFNKEKLQTFYGYVSQKIDKKELRPETEQAYTSNADIKTSQIPLNYPPGASDPSSYMAEIMNLIYDEIYKESVKYNSPNGEKTLTIKEMIDCGQNRCAERFEVRIDSIKAIGSASNSWTGTDVLDFTHTNDGVKVKEVSELKAGANDVKNLKLAKKRGDLLLSAVISEFNKNPSFIKNEDLKTNSTTEYRVTDTGGKYDDPNDKSRNPGQYAQFEISLSIIVRGKKTDPGLTVYDGKITQKIIQLYWVGGRGGFNFNSFIEPGSKEKSVYLKKGRGYLGQFLSDIRYNWTQRKKNPGHPDWRNPFSKMN